MSKVNVSIDTDGKTCAVDVDGMAVDNLYDFSCFRDDYDEGKYRFSFSTREKTGKVMKHTYYAGASSKSAKAALLDGTAEKCDIPGCVKLDNNDSHVQTMIEFLSVEKS